MKTKIELLANRIRINHYGKKELVKYYTSIAWAIAHTALWNGKKFSEEETRKTKELIAAILMRQEQIETGFEEFVQRMLAAKYIQHREDIQFVNVPWLWFTTASAKGYHSTKKNYLAMLDERLDDPQYRVHWKYFGWALCHIKGKIKDRDFHEWRSYFAENSQPLFSMYLAVVARLHLTSPDQTTNEC